MRCLLRAGAAVPDAKTRLYFVEGRLLAAYRNLLGDDLSEKRRAGRSIAPQDSQGYKHVLNRRMAVRRLSAGFGFTCTRGYPM